MPSVIETPCSICRWRCRGHIAIQSKHGVNAYIIPTLLLTTISRDHDELRHSLRSVLQYFRESVNRFVILTSDFDFPVTYSPIKYFLGLSERSNPIDRSLKPGKRRSLSRRSEDDGDDDNEPRALARLGLLPQWLKYNVPQEEDESSEKAQGIGKWKDGNVTLEVVHHAEVYDEYDGTVFNR